MNRFLDDDDVLEELDINDSGSEYQPTKDDEQISSEEYASDKAEHESRERVTKRKERYVTMPNKPFCLSM